MANCSLPLNVKGLSTPGKFNYQNKLRLLGRCLYEVSTAFVGGTFIFYFFWLGIWGVRGWGGVDGLM